MATADEQREHAAAEADAKGVDENGQPETPAVQATEKRKTRNRQLAALAIGAVGIVVAIVFARRNSAASSSTGMPTGLGTSGTLASGPGADGSQLDMSTFGALLSQLQAGQAANTAALGGVNANLTKIQQELDAQHGKPAPKPTPGPVAPPVKSLPKLVANTFAAFLPGYGANAAAVQQVGTVGAGGKYSGHQVTGGAPVYALVGTKFGPVWEQNFNMAQLPAGTKIGTPAELHNYVR